jgi:hypothetical protein
MRKKRKPGKGRSYPGRARVESRDSPPRDRRTALLLALLAFLVYNANFRLIGAGDSYPARFLPFAVLNHGTLYLDPIREVTAQRNPNPYWIQPTPSGHSASLYPVVIPLLVTPVYLPAALWVRWAGETYERMSWLGPLLEKLSASAVAAAAVGWMFPLLRRRIAPRPALLLTLVFAFATSTWVTGSQALWQHGTAELLAVGALWFLTGEPSTRNLLAAGALAGLMVANRPPDLLFTAAVSARCTIRSHRKSRRTSQVPWRSRLSFFSASYLGRSLPDLDRSLPNQGRSECDPGPLPPHHGRGYPSCGPRLADFGRERSDLRAEGSGEGSPACPASPQGGEDLNSFTNERTCRSGREFGASAP